MLLLVDQVKKRTQFLNNYLDKLSDTLERKKYRQALNFMYNQKSNINQSNVSKYNPNTFIIDSLKTKKQKLNQTLSTLQKQKNHLLTQIQSINKNNGVNNMINQQKILTFISKIQFTLKDIRKLQLEPMSLQSNYQITTIKTIQNKKYTIPHNKIFFIDRKSNLINIHCNLQSQNLSFKQSFKQSKETQNLYIVFKFNDQTTTNKWYNVFTFGKLLSQSKRNRYLFLDKNNLDDIEPLTLSKDTTDKKLLTEESQVVAVNANNINAFRTTFMPQNSQKNKNNMYTSSINQKPYINDNSSFQVPRHLTTSMINQQPKKPTLNTYSTYRPTPLNRVRGKSMYLEFNHGKNSYLNKNQKDQDYEANNFFQQKNNLKIQQRNPLKSSSKNTFRKASQDITLRPNNISYQQKKLQKFRSQRNLMDQIVSQSNYQKSKQLNSVNQSNSKRINAQIQMKNQILQRNNRYLDRSVNNTFRPQDNVKWVKQYDQSFSRSSHHTGKHSRFQQQAQYTLSGNHKIQSDQIQQASQMHQVSPTFPKKMVYEDGSNIRLYPVQNTVNRPKANSKTTSQYQSQQNQNVEPLDENQEQHSQSRIVRQQRVNTLDSQTSKEQHEIHESNSQDHEEQEFQQLLEQLKKGIVLTKCAQGSFWTRQKQIKLSQNENTLLIIDIKDKKMKKTPISQIVSVQYGKFSKGIIKHVQQIQEKKCLILSVQEGKEIKKIQFIGNNPQKLLIFSNNLNYYVETFKSS